MWGHPDEFVIAGCWGFEKWFRERSVKLERPSERMVDDLEGSSSFSEDPKQARRFLGECESFLAFLGKASPISLLRS
jgi:hypothetical protein